MLDIVFPLDSVITAIGMVKREVDALRMALAIMTAAIVIAITVMLILAGAIARLIGKHLTAKMPALSLLLLIGVMLVAEGLGQHIPKGYIYSAMASSVFVEPLNLRANKKRNASTQAPV